MGKHKLSILNAITNKIVLRVFANALSNKARNKLNVTYLGVILKILGSFCKMQKNAH